MLFKVSEHGSNPLIVPFLVQHIRPNSPYDNTYPIPHPRHAVYSEYDRTDIGGGGRRQIPKSPEDLPGYSRM